MPIKIDLRPTLAAFLAALAMIVAAAAPSHAQTGFDRRGDDYARFEIDNGDPQACAAQCEHDSKCLAWSFNYPRGANTPAICWLKNKVPTRNDDACCVSGVKGAGVIEPKIGQVEFSIDRLGGDLRDFELPADATGAACGQACTEEGKCRAWTYVRPGYIGGSARCFLKDRITRPRSKPCCISGVVR